MPASATSTAFKDNIGPELVGRLATALPRVDPSFDAAGFRRSALRGLGDLELKARIAHVAAALGATLPDDVVSAIEVVDAVLAAPGSDPDGPPAGLTGWDLWPVTQWVALVGRDAPAQSLELLARLTRFATGEFAIRPFIDDDPAGVHTRLSDWAGRDDEHLRRLVSEGTRPKLPWAPKLTITATDPAYAVDLLDRLVDDPSEYVRRSVSNHLNDLCRVDPSLALEVAGRWSGQSDESNEHQRAWVVRRGLRTLVKAGDARAMRLLGHDPDIAVRAELVLATPRVSMGESVEWMLTLHSLDAATHRVVVDYAIHHVRADGSAGRKVSKWTSFALAPGQRLDLSRRHPIVPITTRTYYSGDHLVEVQVNGVVVATGSFHLQV